MNIEYFRSRLLQAKERVTNLESTRNEASAPVILDQSSVGRLSRMDAMQQQAMAQNTRQRALIELKRIDAAIARCNDGSYGMCISCDDEINPKRLELDPAATLCIDCASNH